eukprot:5536452-Amphidinium_carterae.1
MLEESLQLPSLRLVEQLHTAVKHVQESALNEPSAPCCRTFELLKRVLQCHHCSTMHAGLQQYSEQVPLVSLLATIEKQPWATRSEMSANAALQARHKAT